MKDVKLAPCFKLSSVSPKWGQSRRFGNALSLGRSTTFKNTIQQAETNKFSFALNLKINNSFTTWKQASDKMIRRLDCAIYISAPKLYLLQIIIFLT
jgi:hypothetical protein